MPFLHEMMRLPVIDHLTAMMGLSVKRRASSALNFGIMSLENSLMRILPDKWRILSMAADRGGRRYKSVTLVPRVVGHLTMEVLVSISRHLYCWAVGVGVIVVEKAIDV